MRASSHQSLSLSSIIAAKIPPDPPDVVFFLDPPVFPYDLAPGFLAAEVEESQALVLPEVFFFAPVLLLDFLLEALTACFPDATLLFTRNSNEASSSNHPRLSLSSWAISSRISSFRASVLVSFTDNSLPLVLSSSLFKGTSSTRNSTMSLWYFNGAGGFGVIFVSMVFRCSTFVLTLVSFSTFFGLFSAFAVSKSAWIVSKRSET
mmetsp:Transcript_23376/g.51176  ORF Transcript_23376/g.51176 Transcript_23376/m.51176 type:complete len:206 (+) Transcript_23376:2306-2923(+)